MAAAKPEIALFQRILDINQCIFACMLARYKISVATLILLGSGMSMALVGLLQDETGSGKPKMATSEMELVVCQLLDEIATKFRQQTYISEVQHLNGTSSNTVRPNRKWKIQYGGLKIGNNLIISQLSDEIETKLQWLKLCFRGPEFELHGWEYISTKRILEKPDSFNKMSVHSSTALTTRLFCRLISDIKFI